MYFTYFLYHKPTKLKYYGVKYGKNSDPSQLWVTYFSSSKIVHKMIEEYGVNSFRVQIRKLFDDPKKARDWETRFLTKIDAASSPNWINQRNSCQSYLPKEVKASKGKKKSEEHRINQSKARKKWWNKMKANNPNHTTYFGEPLTEEGKQKISISHKGKKLTEFHKQRISEGLKLCNRKNMKGIPNHKNKKNYLIIYPDESRKVIIGIVDFCKIHNLQPSYMIEVAKGKKRQHKGFKCEYLMENL